ncbi:MAG TPA: HAMP domain-containing sensor histidine kinase [Acidimicrobiales bacterium]|nr:HAMP domain-containing sensor histidine kinase [Acidimicrobiales bacterium]
MTDANHRRTVPVRGWFALAAITTFAMVVVVVLVSVAFFGASDIGAQDQIDDASATLRAGAGQWNDPAWQARASAELDAEGVSFVLFADGQELYRGGADHASVDGHSSTDEVWPADRGDGIVRVIAIDGTDPPLSAQLYAHLDADNPFSGLLRATLAIGLVAAAISLAFGRPFVRWLRAVRSATGRVSEGDLDVALPNSRITEIAAVNAAFDAMTTELDNALEHQAQLEQERRLFIAAIAHDLRTPLFSLRGSLDGLERGIADTPEKRAQYLAIASQKAHTLDALVDDLFDYTRLEYLDQSPDRQPLDLAELLHDLVDGLRSQAETQGVALELWPHDPRCATNADRDQINRAATNLLDNAMRHTPAGGRVDVACGTDASGVWFTVTDTGPGIEPSDLPHVFQPLYRGDRSRSAATGGAGLGLAIAQRIVVAHDGTLRAGSVPEGGAVFTATLPARDPTPAA